MGTEATQQQRVFAGNKETQEGRADMSWHKPALRGQHAHVGGWCREPEERKGKGKRLLEKEEGREGGTR